MWFCHLTPLPLDEIILGGGDGSGGLYTRTLGSQNHYLGVKAHGLYIYIYIYQVAGGCANNAIAASQII